MSALDEHVAGLSSTDADHRRQMAERLWILRDPACIKAVAPFLHDRDPIVVGYLSSMLAGFGPLSEQVLPQLIDVLTRPDFLPEYYPEWFPQHIESSMEAIAKCGSRALEALAVPAKNRDRRIRHRAVRTLSMMDAPVESVESLATEALQDAERWIRLEAMRVAYTLGRASWETRQALEDAARSGKEPFIANVAKVVLNSLDRVQLDSSVTSEVISCISAGAWDECFKATECLVWLREVAMAGLPIVLKLLQRPDKSTSWFNLSRARTDSAWDDTYRKDVCPLLVGQIAVNSDDAFAKVAEFLTKAEGVSPEILVKIALAIGPKSMDSIKGRLVTLLNSTSDADVALALHVVSVVGVDGVLLDSILNALRFGSTEIRRNAAFALSYTPGSIRRREEVIEALREASGDIDPTVGMRAQVALRCMEQIGS
jgi:hypothetical protein